MPASSAATVALGRVAAQAGTQLRDARRSRRMSLEDMVERAGVSVGSGYAAEAGRPVSLETYVRLAIAVGLRPSLVLESGRASVPSRAVGSTRDVVHAAMGECEAAQLSGFGLRVAIDEPYQHFQFAGRADVVAWNLDERQLLHIENKTRLDDIQDVAGAYNAKRAYLANALGERLGVGPRGWRTVTHVLAVLWSAEIMRMLRLRPATFRAVCPDSSRTFAQWWSGDRLDEGLTSVLVILDPDPALGARHRRWIDVDELGSARPRYRAYADAAASVSRR
jgi:hypothetical protein